MDFWLLILTLTCYFLATLIWLGYLWIPKDQLHRYGSWVVGVGWLCHSPALILQTDSPEFFPGGQFWRCSQSLQLDPGDCLSHP